MMTNNSEQLSRSLVDPTLIVSGTLCSRCTNALGVELPDSHDPIPLHVTHIPLMHGSSMYDPPASLVGFTSTVQYLAKLEADLARLRLVADQFTSSCDALMARIQLQRFCLAPIRRLPTELLRLIFVQVVETNDIVSGKPHAMPALTLGQVCQRWRSVAQDFPALWSNITVPHFDYDEVDGPSPSAVTTRLRKCLALSRSQLLDVYFSSGEQGEISSLLDRDFQPFFSALIQHASRWGTLQAFIALTPTLNSHLADTKLPKLTKAAFTTTFSDAESAQVQFLAAAPSLRVLDLGTSWFLDELVAVTLPLEQLSHFTASFFPECLLGRQLSNLQHLVIDPSLAEPWNLDQVVYLPALTTLDFATMDTDIAHFSCPLLEQFSLADCEISARSLSTLFNFSASRSPVLRCLSFNRCSFSHGSLRDMLLQMRLIERFTIHDCFSFDGEDPWGPKETNDFRHYRLLPSLQHLDMSSNYFHESQGPDLLDAVWQRTAGIALGSDNLALESFRLSVPSSSAHKLIQRAEAIKAQGFNMMLFTQDKVPGWPFWQEGSRLV